MPLSTAPPRPHVLRHQLADLADATRAAEREAASRIPGFYASPPDLARRLVALADVSDGLRVLEPSAGSGRIIDAVLAAAPAAILRAYERDHALRDLLARRAVLQAFRVAGIDFREAFGPASYDRVVMAPPLEAAEDLVHIAHAWASHLLAGGRLVAVVSDSTMTRTDNLAQWFRELVRDWSDAPEGEHIPGGVPPDGTPARIIVLHKRIAELGPSRA